MNSEEKAKDVQECLKSAEQQVNEESVNQEAMTEECTKEEIAEILLNTREQGQLMVNLIRNQIEVKDELIDKLHKELSFYKDDATGRYVDQIMKNIIKVRKDMQRIMTTDKYLQMDGEDLREQYQYVFEDLSDLLEQQNVDSYTTEAGADFDASIHQAKIEITEDASLNKKIKESLSEGFRKGEKVFIPERVVVYQYKA